MSAAGDLVPVSGKAATDAHVAPATDRTPQLPHEATGSRLPAHPVRERSLRGHGDALYGSSPKHAPLQTPSSPRGRDTPQASPAEKGHGPASVCQGEELEAESVVFADAQHRRTRFTDASASAALLGCVDLGFVDAERVVDEEMDVASRSKLDEASGGSIKGNAVFEASGRHDACAVANVLAPTPKIDAAGGNVVEVDHGAADSDHGFESRSEQPLASCCVDTRRYPDSWRHTRPRRYAFERPLHSYQIAGQMYCLVVIILFWSSVFAAYVLLYTQDKQDCLAELVAFSTLFGAGVVCVYMFFFWLSFKDCTDRSNSGELCMFCRRRTHVDSKHCKACNKCVEGFDHHCKWLNVCVGRENYIAFFCFVSGSVFTSFTTLGSVICLLARWWHVLAERHSAYFRAGPVVLCIVLLVGIVPIVHLFGFHIYLHFILRTTTYQHIVGKREETFQIPAEEAAPKKTSCCCC
ncbi:DHHC palmitoyltransferase family protein [Leishmania donovani]|uniref:Palmitoyltransferase n=4 Tax=Leishmania donovani species complex TaxID=38574 RepID=A4HV17_LEIIN|nr:putative zinc finger domain protein [Leishmania infantum JPCM5]TPP39889.1 DHHC palmitoyltransferase family protein [Leishmania donovani]CAM66281.1 putative zinc finger domain protein [Leishmania infantum JPCM5]|eukprot:XP_001463908.1 putative zinc finger domain protein [Leishmania infantum JPCM5]